MNRQDESRPIGRRLRHTPLTDVVRGRITGCLDLEGMIADSDLPDPLADLVRRVAHRTRLKRSEQVDVARDLAEHFREGLAAGTDEATLVREFGDERAAARLLRRSMHRKRPAWSRASRRSLQIVLVGLTIAVSLYLFAAVRYWSQRPVIAVDYVARLNEPILEVPESARAWPRIRSSMTEVRGLVSMPDGVSTSTPEGTARDQAVGRITEAMRLSSLEPWSGPDAEAARRQEMSTDRPSPEAIATLADGIEPMLAQLREAASLRSLGREIATGPPRDPADVAFFGLESRVAAAPTNPIAGSVIAIELPHYTTMRSAARLLATDARRALVAGDGGRAVDDVEAVLGLARQVREPSFLIGQLVGMSMEQLAFLVILDGLSTRPEAFADADLERLATIVGELGDGRLAMDLSSERLFFEDLAQRFYTDDGDGGGVLTLRGAEVLGTTPGGATSIGELPSALGFLAAPAVASLTLDRATALRIWNEHFDRCEATIDAEPWSIDRTALGSLDGRPIEETMGDWRGRLRYFPLNLLVPAMDKAVMAGFAVRAERALVETVIGLERARRRADDWPAALSAIPEALLPEPARDPFDGAPLRYAVVDGVPTIWTIGPDRRDDGGREIEDRRDPARGRRLLDSPAPLSSMSDYWGGDRTGEPGLDGDVVVWRGR